MGKRLIIKGADFSANGMYIPNGLSYDSSLCTIPNSGINYQNGQIITSDEYPSWYSSDFIDIGDVSLLILIKAPKANSFGLAFYDSDNNYISGVGYKGNEGGGKFDVPFNAKYIRYCYSNADTRIEFILK